DPPASSRGCACTLGRCPWLEERFHRCERRARDLSVVRSGVVSEDGYSFHMPSEDLPVKPVLVRELIGESLREERGSQGKTLRELSRNARVSLGYLSEVERGQKEASSELLAAICAALDLPLSVVLSLVSEQMAGSERRHSLREC